MPGIRAATPAEVMAYARDLPIGSCLRCGTEADTDEESGLCLDCTEDVWRSA